MADSKSRRKLSELRKRLAALDGERAAIIAEIEALHLAAIEEASSSYAASDQPGGGVHMHSPIQAKIALFRRLFQGRRNVFPVRWENVKSGRNGCSPACRNEWRRGVCNGRWSAHAMASLWTCSRDKTPDTIWTPSSLHTCRIIVRIRSRNAPSSTL